ncbi:MAG: RsmD family RNA methyltransferase [Candidatus Thorarchaeota archaeon]
MSSFNDSWKEVKEGQTEFIIYQDAERIYDASVFYNPKMTINRDFTLLFLATLADDSPHPLTIVDPLAGTGVRSFRILNELPTEKINKIIIGDKNPKAVEIIQKNISDLSFEKKTEIRKSDAYNTISSMIEKKEKLDVIDLDPFGSPISFLEISIKALKKFEGYLLITATDLQVLCGKHSDSCMRIYNALPTRHFLCHEVALRILIYNLLISAGRLGVAIEPIVSYHHEHFLRVKVKVIESKEKANEQHKKIGFVYFCTECSYYKIKQIIESNISINCPVCMKKLEKAGPLWLGELYNKKIVHKMFNVLDDLVLPTKKQLSQILTQVSEEEDTQPFFYFIPFILRFLQKGGVSIKQIIEQLKSNEFQASRTIFDPEGIKTNASYVELVEIINKF